MATLAVGFELAIHVLVDVLQDFEGAPEQGDGGLQDLPAPRLLHTEHQEQKKEQRLQINMTTGSRSHQPIDLANLIRHQFAEGFQGGWRLFQFEELALPGIATDRFEVPRRAERDQSAAGAMVHLDGRYGRAQQQVSLQPRKE